MKPISFYDEIKGIEEYNDTQESDYLNVWLQGSKKLSNMIKALDKERVAHNSLSVEERKEADHGWKIEMLRVAIATRLGFYTRDAMDCFKDSINDEPLQEINNLKAEIKKLHGILKNHNHEYKGSWTSTARWAL